MTSYLTEAIHATVNAVYPTLTDNDTVNCFIVYSQFTLDYPVANEIYSPISDIELGDE